MSSSSSSQGEGLSRNQRLRKSADYLCCYRKGRKQHGSLASLHFHPSEQEDARLGITASRKVGKAVIRHRVKRRIRNIFRQWPRRGELRSMDIVVHVKPAAGRAEFGELRQEIESLLSRLAMSGKSSRSRSGPDQNRPPRKRRRPRRPGKDSDRSVKSGSSETAFI